MYNTMNQKIKFPRSEKVYLPGTLFPELRVAMRKVEQVPSTNFVDGEKVITPNPKVYVYDTSGPFSDPAVEVDLRSLQTNSREKTETPCIRASNTTVPQGPTYCADVFKNVVH